MRVTGGLWRGRTLSAVAGARVRPTSDKVRQSIFNILGEMVCGASVADLCCGSGALGIEALSRGAAQVHFVDIAPACLKTARANLERCGAEPERWRLHRADATRWLGKHLAAGAAPLLVLADPPYDGTVAATLAALFLAAPAAGIMAAVLEHSPALSWPATMSADAAWNRETRAYGRTALTLLRPRDACAPEDRHA